MKIAIIGAGFFGSTIALKLSKKHTVHLFEKEKDILNGASRVNQFRFHMGFHYPRSQKTIKEINNIPVSVSETLLKKCLSIQFSNQLKFLTYNSFFISDL